MCVITKCIQTKDLIQKPSDANVQNVHFFYVSKIHRSQWFFESFEKRKLHNYNFSLSAVTLDGLIFKRKNDRNDCRIETDRATVNL